MNPSQPTTSRLEVLDAIRGFSLLGILIVNLLTFHSPHFLNGGLDEFYEGTLNTVVITSIDLFVQASFYPLFSLLFGIGIYMMYERLNERGILAKRVLKRRMFVLAFIGLIHGVLLWYGDILLTYAVVGFISLWFLHKHSNSLKKWAINLLWIPAVFLTLLSYPVREELNVTNDQRILDSFNAYKGEGIVYLTQNLSDWLYVNGFFQWIGVVFTILPMFLIGMMIQQRGWVKHPEHHRSDIMIWLWASLIIFIVFKISPHFVGMPVWLNTIQDAIGGSFSSIFYFLLLLVSFRRRNFLIVTRILSNVGKLSLTNYIMQTIIAMTIFYGYGFNLYGELHAATLVFIALGIYIFQLIFSTWYVKRFYYGPLEWFYRTLTYGKRQPMIKKGD